jgi:chemotaxis protein CheX
MESSLQIECQPADVARIVEDVFCTMLGLQVISSPEAGSPARDSLTGAVHFAGAWKGAVLLQCSPRQALAFTARLMPGREPRQIDEDVRDTLGELANMVGGNLKSVLHPGVALSMPSVVEGSDYALHICGGNAAMKSTFSSDLGVFWVTVVQMLDKQSRK